MLPKSYRCQYCSHTTSKRTNIFRHLIRNHSNYVPFNCETCGKPFPGRHELLAHVRYSHSAKMKKTHSFKLFSPDTSSSDSEVDGEAHQEVIDRLESMEMKGRNSRRFFCWKCSANLPTRVGLNDHIMLVHYGMKNYRCEFCFKRFEATLVLKKHMKECHDHTLFYRCQYCDVRFPNKTLLFQHYHRVHHDTPAVRYFKDTDSGIILDYIPSMVMGGATDNFSVYVPVVTRCGGEISEKAANYSKTVKAENVASILSILGIVSKEKAVSDPVECPSVKLNESTASADRVSSSSDLSADESEIDVKSLSVHSAETAISKTAIKQELPHADNYEELNSCAVKTEPIAVKEEPVDVPIDHVVHIFYESDDYPLADTDSAANGMVALKEEPSTDARASSDACNYNVDFTDNHISDSEAYLSDEELLSQQPVTGKGIPSHKKSGQKFYTRVGVTSYHIRDGEASFSDEEELLPMRKRTHVDSDSSYVPSDEQEQLPVRTARQHFVRTNSSVSSDKQKKLPARKARQRVAKANLLISSDEEELMPVGKKKQRVEKDSTYVPSDEESTVVNDQTISEMEEYNTSVDGEEESDDQKVGEEKITRLMGLRVNYGFTAVRKCQYCDEMHTVDNMRSHLATKHRAKGAGGSKFSTDGFLCQFCPFLTKWKKSLRDHVRAKHSPDVEPFKCEQCSYSTKLKAALKKHVQFVHELRRFSCSQCTSTFANATDMKDHIAVRHEGRRSHHCKLCGYTAAYRSELYTHIKKFHKCVMCKFTHSDPLELANHMAEEHAIPSNPHIQVRKWTCRWDNCGYIGTNKSKYEHLKVVHSITLPWPKDKPLDTECKMREDRLKSTFMSTSNLRRVANKTINVKQLYKKSCTDATKGNTKPKVRKHHLTQKLKQKVAVNTSSKRSIQLNPQQTSIIAGAVGKPLSVRTVEELQNVPMRMSCSAIPQTVTVDQSCGGHAEGHAAAAAVTDQVQLLNRDTSSTSVYAPFRVPESENPSRTIVVLISQSL